MDIAVPGTQPGEIWRWVKDLDQQCAASNLGRVYSFRSKMFLHIRGKRSPTAIKQIAMTNNQGKKVSIPLPQMVCEAFHGPRPPGMDAVNRDGNPWNNHVDNLYWASRKDLLSVRAQKKGSA